LDGPADDGPATHSESGKNMVTIRLTRRGAKNTPFYHVVVTDSRKRQGGMSLENVGFFNPTARKGAERLKLDLDRIDYWIGKGAQQSDRVRSLVAGYRKQAAAPAV
jgi:small subunit ribosomal protein S16